MAFVSRAFRGRPHKEPRDSRLPPGQYLVRDFPVLSAGPTPRTSLGEWTFSIEGEVDEEKHWSWEDLRKLPEHMGVPIIFLTTESDADLKARAKAAGATGWLTKPFYPENLIKITRKVLGR